jgi:uncharacterized protein
MKIGVISDTHGVLRTEAAEILKGSAMILHAGDIGRIEVLDALAEIAPVEAVRGNVDYGMWANALPERRLIEIGGASIYLLHDLAGLDLDPAAAGLGCVIFGHSHRPSLEKKEGVLYLNPGSAGPRRRKLPVSLATLRVENGAIDVRFFELED